MKTNPRLAVADEWSLVERLLPPGWQAQAKPMGALRRARGIPNATILLRVLLLHLACGCSLAETALRAAKAGWCRLSVVALIKRLRSAESWLNWLCQRLWVARGRALPSLRCRVRAVDSSMVTEGGLRGSQWRIHFALNLGDLRCDFFELTDQRSGESLRRIPVRAGELLLADRGLMRATGIASVTQRRAHVLGRVNLHNLPLYEGQGRPFRALVRLRKLSVGDTSDWRAYARDEQGSLIAGRLIALRRSSRSREKARRSVQRKAQQQGRKPSRRALELADYVLLWTDLARAKLSAKDAAELYRQRWQIELAFKRDKSLLGLGQLPKRNAQSSRAWINGKLLVGLLIEQLIAQADAVSPWGYPLAPASQPLARDALDVARIANRDRAAIRPGSEPARVERNHPSPGGTETTESESLS